jgi:hypothetical protein
MRNRSERVNVHVARGRSMTALTLRLAALLCLPPALSFAGSWSGALVDSKCYDAEERNVNPTDTLTNVDRDGNREIRYCSPSAKTRSFTLVQSDGPSLKLDDAGNARAAELVRKAGKKSLRIVAVTGEMERNTIKVDSIATAR